MLKNGAVIVESSLPKTVQVVPEAHHEQVEGNFPNSGGRHLVTFDDAKKAYVFWFSYIQAYYKRKKFI